MSGVPLIEVPESQTLEINTVVIQGENLSICVLRYGLVIDRTHVGCGKGDFLKPRELYSGFSENTITDTCDPLCRSAAFHS